MTFDSDMSAEDATAEGSVLNTDNYVLTTESGVAITILDVSYDTATRTATLTVDGLETDVYTLAIAETVTSLSGLSLGHEVASTFHVLTDFSAVVDIQFDRTRRDRQNGTISYDVTVTNTGGAELALPLRLVMDPARYFSGAATEGVGDGDLWLIDLGTGQEPDATFAPGETLSATTATFLAPEGLHLGVEHGVYALPPANTPPTLSEDPLEYATVGEEYRTTLAIEDAEGGEFAFVLMQGP